MKTATLAVKQALRQQVLHAAFLFDCDTSLGHVYVWSGAGTLPYDGNDYLGLGTLGQAQIAAESTEIKTLQSQYSLTGPQISDESQTITDAVIRGRLARYQLAFLDESMNVIPDPIILDQTIMDTLAINVSETLEQTLTITGTSAIFDFARPLNQTISNESQIAVFPGDTGFDRIPGHVVDKTVKWSRS